jgi:hypothetical protein
MRTIYGLPRQAVSLTAAALCVFLATRPSNAPAQYFGDLYDAEPSFVADARFSPPTLQSDRWRERHHHHEPRERPTAGPLLYLQDRFLDMADFLRLKIGVGGFGFNARGTALAQIGMVYTNGVFMGFDRRAWGIWREERYAWGFSLAYHTEIATTYYAGNEFADPLSPWNDLNPRRGYIRNDEGWDDLRWRPFSAGAEVHFGIGVDVALYPEEVLDFVFGFFLIDFLHDDLANLEYTYYDEGEIY